MATKTATRTPKRRAKTTATPKASAAKAKTTTATKAKPAVKAPATKRTTSKKAEPTKVAPKSKATKAPASEKAATSPRELNLHGFIPGSDSALIVDAMIAGGASRKEVNQAAADAIEKVNGLKTRSGGDKNVPSLTSALLSRLQEKGYTVSESWVVVPPADVAASLKKEEAAAKRRATRASKK